jgi:MFS family permease
MSTPTAPAEKAAKDSTYINNPFFIAAEGIKTFFTKAMGVAILLVILSVASAYPYGGVNFEQPTQDPAAQVAQPEPFPAVNTETVLTVTGIVLGVLIVAIAVGTIIAGIIAYSSAQIASGKTATLKAAWQAILKNFWSFLWLQILTGLKVLAWTLLFIIPGIIMAIRYSLANIAFFDKGLKGNAAIKESLALTKGSWITTFSAQTLFNLITFSMISGLVTASATAMLYRQFSTTPLADRPKTHGLSIATLVVTIVGIILLVALGVLFAYAVSNYHNGTTIDTQAI